MFAPILKDMLLLLESLVHLVACIFTEGYDLPDVDDSLVTPLP